MNTVLASLLYLTSAILGGAAVWIGSRGARHRFAIDCARGTVAHLSYQMEANVPAVELVGEVSDLDDEMQAQVSNACRVGWVYACRAMRNSVMQIDIPDHVPDNLGDPQ